VVNGATVPRRGPAAVSAASVPTAGAVGSGGFVSTRLPADAGVVVVIVDPVGDDRDLTGLTLGLDGATRAISPDGAAVPPAVVASGPRMCLLYGITPAEGVPAVEVTVGASARWRLAGVLGAPGDVATTAAQLAGSGPANAAAPQIRSPIGSATVSWNVPAEVN
jgi:hypothetical protein